MKFLTIKEGTIVPMFVTYFLDNEYNRFICEKNEESLDSFVCSKLFDPRENITISTGQALIDHERKDCILCCYDNNDGNSLFIPALSFELGTSKMLVQTVSFYKNASEIFYDWDNLHISDFFKMNISEYLLDTLVELSGTKLSLLELYKIADDEWYTLMEHDDMCWYVEDIKSNEIYNINVDLIDDNGRINEI